MEAIVLAGGLGTRLRAVVPDVPKPMAPVLGRPFLEFLLDYWITQGVCRFILSVGYRAKTVQDHFGSSYHGVPVDYSVEQEPLGTGGGVRLAVAQLKALDSFLILNGDTFFKVDLKKMTQFHKDAKSEMTLALLKKSTEGRYGGVILGERSKIIDVGKKVITGEALINGGVYLVSSEFGQTWIQKREGNFVSSFENDLMPSWINQGRSFYGFVSSGKFIDIGVPEDYHRAHEVLAT